MATKTAVIVVYGLEVLIWAIPPLSPQPPDFNERNPTHIRPLFRIPFPDDIVPHSSFVKWKTISSWYFGSTQPLYFDMSCQDLKRHRFKIILKPDLSTASLHVVNTPELTPHNFPFVYMEDYRICEDTLVSCWFVHANRLDTPSRSRFQWGVYTGSMSARFSNITGGPAFKMLLPIIDIRSKCRYILCPASGRFVLRDIDDVAVLDIF